MASRSDTPEWDGPRFPNRADPEFMRVVVFCEKCLKPCQIVGMSYDFESKQLTADVTHHDKRGTVLLQSPFNDWIIVSLVQGTMRRFYGRYN